MGFKEDGEAGSGSSEGMASPVAFGVNPRYMCYQRMFGISDEGTHSP